MVEVDDQTLQMLEFEKVLALAARHVITPAARERILSLRPVDSIQHINERIQLISDCRRLLQDGHVFGIEHFEAMEPLFKRLKPEESVLDPMEIRMFVPLFRSVVNLKALATEAGTMKIGEILSALHGHSSLLSEIDRCIEPDGRIADEASVELYQVRQRIKAVDRRIKTILEKILNDRSLKPHIQDFYITERNGRKVIPVKTDSKGHIRGVIHDISNTGETVFVEPNETLQLGNELESLKAEEKVQEYRVLKRLTSLLRDVVEEIQHDHDIVIYVDMLQALASFAEQMKMTPPDVKDRDGAQELRFTGARHPLLYRSLSESGRLHELVPLDFYIKNPYRGMVITGINTGGKTVVLKTVGVLVLMALTGLHLPADSANIPMLKRVIADIGDEQSIEQNLSTFSGHLLRLKEIVENSDNSSLVIIDELGTGTDPDEGGALGCAILKRLVTKGAIFVVSTHLGLLKAYAYRNPYIVNGAMQVQTEHQDGRTVFIPTYRLQIGEPGQSYALHIARRFGLPEDLIEDAREFLRQRGSILEDTLQELKERQQVLEKKMMEVEGLKEELQMLRQQLQQQLKDLKQKKSDVLRQAHREAENILRQTRLEAEEILKKLRTVDRQQSRSMLKRLDALVAEHTKKGGAEVHLSSYKRPDRLYRGKKVFIVPPGVMGVIVDVQRRSERCKVSVMGKEIEVSVDSVFEPSDVQDTETGHYEKTDALRTLPSTELKLIGLRVEDALRELERFLNTASVEGIEQVRVIHGAGTGRLREAVRQYLKGHPLVSEFFSDPDERGDKTTIVVLR